MEEVPSHVEATPGSCCKLVERAAAESELRQRLMEQAAVLAYEVNQPLTAIALNAATSLHWLSSKISDLDEVRRLVSRIESDARRAAIAVVTAHLSHSLRSQFVRPVDLNEVVVNVILSIREEVERSSVTLLLDLAPRLPSLTAVAVSLQSIVADLALNAIWAMKAAETEHRTLLIRTSITAANVIRVEMEDNGPPVEFRNVNHIFGSSFDRVSDSIAYCDAVWRSIAGYGGTAGAANKGEGTGAQIWLALPVVV